MFSRIAPQLLSHSTHSAPRRGYASVAAGGKRSLPLIAAALVAGAGGAYYAFGGGISPNETEMDDRAKRDVGTAAKASSGESALNSEEFRTFKLLEKIPFNHNTARFIFELPPGKESGLTVASALVTKSAASEGEGACLDSKGKPVIRPYTPVTAPGVEGKLELLVKKYPEGKMTGHIHNLNPGDSLAMKGPIPKFPYKANEFETIGMIAGGSGITPHWQIIQQIASKPEDKTKVILLFSNQEEKDILLRKEFDDLVARNPSQFKVTYVLDRPPPSWSGLKGFLTAPILSQELPSPSLGDKVKIFVCGPPGQMRALSGAKKSPKDQGELEGALKEVGFSKEQVYKF